MTMLFRVTGILLLCAIAHARCSPRTVTIQYKAFQAVNISVRGPCASKHCPPILLSIPSVCTNWFCAKNSPCNYCTAKLHAHDIPPSESMLGVYFAGESTPFYKFSADWSYASHEWYEANDWITGCESRVGCVTRSGLGGNGKLNVAITAQACYPNMFRYLNALSLDGCVNGDTQMGVPLGQIFGVNCAEMGL